MLDTSPLTSPAHRTQIASVCRLSVCSTPLSIAIATGYQVDIALLLLEAGAMYVQTSNLRCYVRFERLVLCRPDLTLATGPEGRHLPAKVVDLGAPFALAVAAQLIHFSFLIIDCSKSFWQHCTAGRSR